MSGWLPRLLLSLLLLPAWAAAVEQIEDFSVRLELGRDGMLQVSERITVQAEGQLIKHGLFRDLPTLYRLPSGLLRHTPIEALKVTRDGQPEPVRREAFGAGERLYLGAPEQLLTPGRYSYELHYRVDPQVIQRDGVDELYWNVTGNDWQLPIAQVSVALQLPAGARLGNVLGYTGASGERGQDWRIVEQREDYLQLATSAVLPAQHGFTLAVDWPAGVLARPSSAQQWWRLLGDNLGFSLGSLLLLGLLGYYGQVWRRVGRDPRAGLIIVQFAAPPGLSPASAGWLWQRGFRGYFNPSLALAVTVTDLAITQHLSLADGPRGDGYVLTRGSAPAESLRPLEANLLQGLFAGQSGTPSLHIGQRYLPPLATAVAGLTAQLEGEGKAWHSLHRRQWWLGLLWAIGACLLSVSLGLQGQQWGEALAGLVFSLGLGVPAAVALVAARHEPNWLRSLALGALGLLLSCGVPVGLWMLSVAVSAPVLVLVAAYALLVLGSYWWLEAPSVLGRRLLDGLAGYREYLQLAERDTHARASGGPTMSIALYERHLAYAMALNVEHAWTARFSEALRSGLIDLPEQGYQPQWYQGRSSVGAGPAFASNLCSGLSSATAIAQAAPSPASAGSSGGSSAGGASGGGSGGGGGGGW
jgi:uncharacterized membrane protein YgcG